MKKTNYLNNKDILKEIHKSKKSYCAYRDQTLDSDYDIIISSVDEITQDLIKEAQDARATRLAKLAQEEELAKGNKRKLAEFLVDADSVPITDLVFRVTTWDHIPIDQDKQAKADAKAQAEYEDGNDYNDDDIGEIRGDTKYLKLNFPPFFHYRLDKHANPYIVAKSHWRGDLDTGEFCKTHGQMTNKLALMFIKLCERYATRSNWRGYCVDQETEALTQRGWLTHSEITEDDTILSYNGEQLAWSPIHSIFRDQYQGKMFKLTTRGIDSLITPGHKLVTTDGLVKVEHLLQSDRLVVLGDRVKDNKTKTYSNELVELIGWVVTEGNLQPKKKIVSIYQNQGNYADRIRNCLSTLGYEFTEKKSFNSENITFAIKRKHWNEITKLVPNKMFTMDFVLALTGDQQDLLINTMINGDGHRNGFLLRYTQKDKQHMDTFQALCTIAGKKTNVKFVENKMSFGKLVNYYTATVFSPRGNYTRGECVNLHGGKNNNRKHIGKGKQHHPNFPTVDYSGLVWCPETDYGSFVARRNGKVYLSGNTYNDEMRGQALLQLSQIGLQFDESKSQNPFAYYTAAITNSFTRVLNIEKRNQNIRDDILEMNDLTPSFTRQLAHEFKNDPNKS